METPEALELTLNTLPDDVLQYIASLLDLKSLVRLGMADKFFNESVNTKWANSIWKHQYEKTFHKGSINWGTYREEYESVYSIMKRMVPDPYKTIFLLIINNNVIALRALFEKSNEKFLPLLLTPLAEPIKRHLLAHPFTVKNSQGKMVKITVEHAELYSLHLYNLIQIAMQKGTLELIECLIAITKIKGSGLIEHFLFPAIEFGRLDCVKMLCDEYQIDINTCFSKNKTDRFANSLKYHVLHYTIKCQQFAIMQFLIDQGADIHAGFECVISLGDRENRQESRVKQTAFTLALFYYNQNIIDLLLKKGANLDDCKDDAGLFIPYFINKITLRDCNIPQLDRTLVFLLDNNVTCGTGNQNFFHQLIQLNCIKTFKHFSASINDQINSLWETAMHTHNETIIEFITFLRSLGVDIDMQFPVNLSSALHLAALRGNTTVLMCLLDQQANVNLSDCEGQTPLFRAVKREQFFSIKLLLIYGADPNIKDNAGATVEQYAYADDSLALINEFRNFKKAWDNAANEPSASLIAQISAVLKEWVASSESKESANDNFLEQLRQFVNKELASWDKAEFHDIKASLKKIEIFNNDKIDSLSFRLQFIFHQLTHPKPLQIDAENTASNTMALGQ